VSDAVKHWGIRYRAHNGVSRWAVVVVPAQYGPRNLPPALPLVISPHGRGVRARTNARLWGDLPAQGGFAVICPGGMGRRLPLHSWGWRGQINDLARMPSILRAARPWLRIDTRRMYAVGGRLSVLLAPGTLGLRPPGGDEVAIFSTCALWGLWKPGPFPAPSASPRPPPAPRRGRFTRLSRLRRVAAARSSSNPLKSSPGPTRPRPDGNRQRRHAVSE
jgi:hypothetical protein